MTKIAKRIIWTVDPFAEERDLQRSAAWAIKNLIQGFESTIEPVYFFSAYLTDVYRLGVPKEWTQEVRKKGQKKLNKIIGRVNLQNIKPLHIITEPYLSMREGVEKINLIARRWKADAIVTSTHARKGIKRMFLGSFAETLLLHSTVPLFFVNPHWIRRKQFKNILFPTDFSKESKEAFLRVLSLAQSMNIEVTLFHKLAYVWPPTVAVSAGSFPLYTNVFEQELEARKKDALEWSEQAKEKGVRIRSVIDQRLEDSVARAVIKAGKRHPGMIAMASRSGPARTALLGSTTRTLVRESPYPVWVFHPHPEVQEKPEPLFNSTEEDIEKDLTRISQVKKSA